MTILHYLLITLIYAFLAFLALKILKFYGFISYGVHVITRVNTVFSKDDVTWGKKLVSEM